MDEQTRQQLFNWEKVITQLRKDNESEILRDDELEHNLYLLRSYNDMYAIKLAQETINDKVLTKTNRTLTYTDHNGITVNSLHWNQ